MHCFQVQLVLDCDSAWSLIFVYGANFKLLKCLSPQDLSWADLTKQVGVKPQLDRGQAGGPDQPGQVGRGFPGGETGESSPDIQPHSEELDWKLLLDEEEFKVVSLFQ